MVIIQLGKVDPSHLGVFAPTTSDEEGAKSIHELRAGLHADYVLEGSVRRALDQLRIDAVLISTRDGSQVWSKSYTGGAQDILKLEDNVTTRYAPALYFAAVYTGLGDQDHSFEWLQKAYDEQNDRLPYLGVDPIADSLRSDPRFRPLMKRCGLP